MSCTAAGAKRAKPTRSNLVRIVRISVVPVGFVVCSGMWTKRSRAATRPPIGRLILKVAHQHVIEDSQSKKNQDECRVLSQRS